MRRAAGICALAASLALMSPVNAQEAGQQDGNAAPEAVPAAPQPEAVGSAPAPQAVSPIMTIDQDELFLGSAWGKRAQASAQSRMSAIDAENERLISQLAAEEQELTLLRATLPVEEFRQRADEFDARVTQARRDAERVSAELEAAIQSERTAFLRAALPILASIMRERGAQVVLHKSATFVAIQSVDVTEELIRRVDEEIGPGPAAGPAGDAPAPQPTSPEATAPTAPQPTDPAPAPAPPATQPATPGTTP